MNHFVISIILMMTIGMLSINKIFYMLFIGISISYVQFMFINDLQWYLLFLYLFNWVIKKFINYLSTQKTNLKIPYYSMLFAYESAMWTLITIFQTFIL